MKTPLRELGGEIRSVDLGDGVSRSAVWFTCPVCTGVVAGHYHIVPFGPEATRVNGSLVWKHESGTTIDDITLSPSYLVYTCNNLHGFVQNGHWVGC